MLTVGATNYVIFPQETLIVIGKIEKNRYMNLK